jgi:glycosyltransferase involved in cell wall biosynthesis
VAPRHLAIVLPNTGAFDSRTYRLARDAAARGHLVTVYARLPRVGEADPLGIGGNALAALEGVTYRAVAVDRTALVPGLLRAPASVIGRFVGRLLPGGLRRIIGVMLDTAAHGRATEGQAQPADAWHAMGMLALPVALRLRRRHGGKVVYDSREIYIEARNLARLPGPARWLVARWELGRARQADILLTVNEACRRMLRRRFGRDLVVAYNCPDTPTTPIARGHRLHERLGLADDTAVILYHGAISPGRGIEQLIEAIVLVPDAVLAIMGYGEDEAALRAKLAANPNDRVRLLPPVPPSEVLVWVASADVAAMPIQPTTRNHRISTPNKLFEAMTAGVPVVASDMPGMRPIVRAAGCGVLVEPRDPQAIAAGLRQILDLLPAERAAMGDRGRAAIGDRFGWARQRDAILGAYAEATGLPW